MMKPTTILMLAGAAVVLGSCSKSAADYDASGVFEVTEVIVSARSSGEVKSFTLEEGQQVSKGEVLGSIDHTQLELKKTQLRATRSATTDRKLSIDSQVASLRQQLSNLQRERNRFAALLKDGAATQKQVDDIDYQMSVVRKQIAATTEQITTGNNSIDDQSGSIDAQISQVDDQIKNAVITSPIAGVVLGKYVEPGEYAAVGKPLFKVGDLTTMKLRAYITADQLTRVKMGQQVTVFADYGSDGRKEYKGTVSWISDHAEFTPKTIQTRDERANLVYAIKITVRNDGFIKRGMYGDVKF